MLTVVFFFAHACFISLIELTLFLRINISTLCDYTVSLPLFILSLC